MSVYVIPGQEFEATTSGAPTGIAGTIGVRILDNIGGEVLARTTAGIIELIAGSGMYAVTLTAPTVAGNYTVFWDTGVVSETTTATEDLVVTYSAPFPTAAPAFGTIADRVRTYIPSTYDALMRATTTMGATLMANTIDMIKFRLTGTAISALWEATTYDPFVQDYIAKVATLRIIPAGADYWADQLTSETAREESIQYPDRINSLWRIHERLLMEMRQDQPFFERLFPAKLKRGPLGMPRVDTDGPLLTLDPATFFPERIRRRLYDPFRGKAWEEPTSGNA